MISNELYDKLQKIMRCIAPIATFLTAMAEIWGIEWMGPVTATLAAFSIFLGQFLDASSKKYKKAKEVDENQNGEKQEE